MFFPITEQKTKTKIKQQKNRFGKEKQNEKIMKITTLCVSAFAFELVFHFFFYLMYLQNYN